MPQHPIPSASTQEQQQLSSNQSNNNSQQSQVATIEAPPRTIQIPVVTCDFASDMSTSEVGDRDSGENQVAGAKDLLRVGAAGVTTANIRNVVTTTTTLSSSNGTGTTTTTTTSVNALQVSPMAGRCRALSVGIETDMVSEFDPSSSDSGVVSRCAAVKPHKFRVFQPIFGRRGANSRKDANSKQPHHQSNKSAAAAATAANNNKAAELQPALPKKEKARDPEKEKRRIARKKEKRATLILGLIMGSFIACWLPFFFFLYILVPMCPKCIIPEAAFSLAFWLGYMNSALNPAIYTIFNKDFRRAFRRILFK